MKSFEIHWHTPFFHSRQICGRISRSPFWLPESALELSTGRCWKRQPQMVQVHNYFSLKCSRIIRLMLGYFYNYMTWKRLHEGFQGHLQSPLIIIKKRFFFLRNREKIHVRQGIIYLVSDLNDIPNRYLAELLNNWHFIPEYLSSLLKNVKFRLSGCS